MPVQLLLLILCFFSTICALAQEKISLDQNWALPFIIDDSNTHINFQVDSTWVLVNGVAKGIKGSITYLKNSDSVMNTELILPVSELSTGLSMRDNHMLEIMASDNNPDIMVLLSADVTNCKPSTLRTVGHCELMQKGQITIRGITREITLKSLVKKTQSGYEASGEIVFPWASFGIEDPSNFFAKLREDVSVFYTVVLPEPLHK